jgi:lipopolysaccharide export LptBFGC system permease protein LptF
MRKIIPIIISFCLLMVLSAKSSSFIPDITSNNKSPLLDHAQIKIVPAKLGQIKLSLKERYILKWYKKKINRIISEEEKKKKIQLLGKLSLWSSIAAIVLIFVPFGFFLSVLLFPASLVLGIMSLNRRKRLADKSGVSKWPAIIGIIISSLVILIFGLYLLTYAISGGG